MPPGPAAFAEEAEQEPAAWQTGLPSSQPRDVAPPAASSSARAASPDIQRALDQAQLAAYQQVMSGHSAKGTDPDPQQAYQRWQHAQHAQQAQQADMQAPMPSAQAAQHAQQAQQQAQQAHHVQHGEQAQQAQHAQQGEHMEVIQGLAQHLQAVQQKIAQLQQCAAAVQQQQQLGSPPEAPAAAQQRAQQLAGLQQIDHQVRMSKI